jgi:hypothetical protein
VTDGGIQYLKPMKKLVYVDLSFTNVTDAGLKELAVQVPNLLGIDLYHTKVTDVGIGYRPKFTVDGFRVLKSNKNLKEISLYTREDEDVEPYRGVLPGVRVGQSTGTPPQDDE